MLTQRHTTAANKHKCLLHRPIALTSPMSVNIDIRGAGVRPTVTTSRMTVCFTDTGIMYGCYYHRWTGPRLSIIGSCCHVRVIRTARPRICARDLLSPRQPTCQNITHDSYCVFGTCSCVIASSEVMTCRLLKCWLGHPMKHVLITYIYIYIYTYMYSVRITLFNADITPHYII